MSCSDLYGRKRQLHHHRHSKYHRNVPDLIINTAAYTLLGSLEAIIQKHRHTEILRQCHRDESKQA